MILLLQYTLIFASVLLSGGVGRVLLRTLRHHQHRPGGHHGAGRPRRCADHEVSARRHSGAGHGAPGHPVLYGSGRDLLPAPGCGRRQLQRRPDPGRHRHEPAGRGCRHCLCQGHEHRRERGQRVLYHPVHQRQERLFVPHRRVRLQLVHAGGPHRPDAVLHRPLQDPLRPAPVRLRRASPGGGLAWASTSTKCATPAS